jgi:hypothetical protein
MGDIYFPLNGNCHRPRTRSNRRQNDLHVAMDKLKINQINSELLPVRAVTVSLTCQELDCPYPLINQYYYSITLNTNF